MNNQQLNHFSRSPVNLDISRSVFQRNKRKLTTFQTGQLIPLMVEEVLPGDSVSMKVNSLVRMATPFHPVMDNAFMDIHAYFVPNRQVWEHWKEFYGENSSSPWAAPMNYTIPQVTAPSQGGDEVSGSSVTGWAKGTIADYMQLPIKVGNLSVSMLPFRAYTLIWNNYYRDQNTMSPATVSLTDGTKTGSNQGIMRASGVTLEQQYDSYINNGTYVTHAEKGGAPLPVCKLHDYFTSCLPSPQKGAAVLMPLGMTAPVKNVPFSSVQTSDMINLQYYDNSYSTPTKLVRSSLGTDNLGISTYKADSDMTSNLAAVALYADLSNATAASVNALRNAFMVQRFYERLARGGSRYFEVIRSFYGVIVPDLTVQIPEFLGGRRVPINMTQVAQTSASQSGVTPQGNLSAYSLTTDTSDELFHKSFTEHGYLIVVGCIRAEHSYSQGIPRHFSRKTFTDFYVPTFANAPEQPVYMKELFANGIAANDDAVFGYQEAWAEYRYALSEISGEFRPTYAQSLDSYHYGDYYTSQPTLSAGWMREPSSLVSRTLAVTSHHQWLADFLFDCKWVRPMPAYSVPGLLDHH